jgi:pimeloyl-[acyl-carrier protein] methyl ester esterase
MKELYVEINGTGPDLVLLHGWGLNVRVWDGLVEELRDRYRMIAVDLPGHGQSAWSSGRGTPAEQAWLLHSTLASVSNRYSLLGWSLGGQIALDLAAAMPGQIDRLVLVAATPRFAQSPDWPYGMPPAVITKLATQLRQDYRRTVSDFLELQVRGSIEGSGVLDQLRHALFVHGEAQPGALEAGLNTLATSDLRPTLSHVRAPTLVIAGRNDRITAPAASHALARALPDARYVEMRRAAHAPFLSHRGEFATLVDRFLRGADIQEGVAGSGSNFGEGAVVGAAAVGGMPVGRAAVVGGTVVGRTAVSGAAVGGTAVGRTVVGGTAVGRTAVRGEPTRETARGGAVIGGTARDRAASGRTVSNPAKGGGGAVARPAAKATQGRPAKKKRMKARARKKLKASSR